MPADLVTQTVKLAGGDLRVLQPAEWADLPDDGGVEWAPIAPYSSVLWRSGVALAHVVGASELPGMRVVELGCGLGLPSIAAARAGAEVLATDADPDALPLVERNARENGTRIDAAAIDWLEPGDLLARAPFDLVLAADVLYDPAAVDPLLDLLPRLAPEALLADPGREPALRFLDQARDRWTVDAAAERGVVRIHRLRFG